MTNPRSKAPSTSPTKSMPKSNCCQRCGGYTVPADFYCDGEKFTGTRCIHCGDVLDPLILFHRQYGSGATLPKSLAKELGVDTSGGSKIRRGGVKI